MPRVSRTARAFGPGLAAIAILGVGLRALYLVTLGHDITGLGDWHFYHFQANLLADGRGFLEPFQLQVGKEVPSAAHPPLYPLALSVVSWLGGTGVMSHRAFGLLCATATIGLLGLLGRRIAGSQVGLLAAGLYALHPSMVAVDAALMSETLYGPLVVGTLLAMTVLLDRPRPALAVLTGVLVGLAALTRAEALFLGIALAALVTWRTPSPGRILRGAVLLGAMALVIAPWTIRNAIRFDSLVPISTNAAGVLAGANCDKTYRGEDMGAWNITCISPRRFDDEGEQAAVWRDEGRAYIEDNLARLPAVLAVRELRVWDLWQPRRQIMFAEGRHRDIQQAGVVVWGVLAAFALGGVAVWWRRRRDAVLVLLAPAVVVAVTALMTYGVPRLRHAFEVPMAVLAAAGILALARRVRHPPDARPPA